MSKDEISIFRREGVDIRTVLINGDPYFVGVDVTRALGFKNGRDAITRHTKPEHRGVSRFATPSGVQDLTVISEAAVYRLVMRSNTADAEAFQEWLASEVIPAIRKTGSFVAAPVERAIPQTFAEALRDFAAEIDAHEATKAELAEVAPRAEAWDAIASAAGDYAVGDAAKMLARAGIPTGPQRLFEQLAGLKWTYRGEGGKWRAYAERVEKGYLTERPQFHYHPKTGERVIDQPQLRVTIKGLERLRQRLHVGALQAVGA